MSQSSLDRVHAALDGRSVAWLARQLGVTRTTVYLWARGMGVTRDRAREIERLLGVPASQLFPNVED